MAYVFILIASSIVLYFVWFFHQQNQHLASLQQEMQKRKEKLEREKALSR